MEPVYIFFIVATIIVTLIVIGSIVSRYLYNKKWNQIESLNAKIGITRYNVHLDKNGYFRWNENDRLCHRDVAFKELYTGNDKKIDIDTGTITGKYTLPFSSYDVHHVDKNKFNCNAGNLEILTREEHQVEHGTLIEIDGKKYVKLARTSKIYRETEKAILVAYQWVPKSQIVVRDGYIFIPVWLYYKKFKSN
jgi:hypothetical protein